MFSRLWMLHGLCEICIQAAQMEHPDEVDFFNIFPPCGPSVEVSACLQKMSVLDMADSVFICPHTVLLRRCIKESSARFIDPGWQLLFLWMRLGTLRCMDLEMLWVLIPTHSVWVSHSPPKPKLTTRVLSVDVCKKASRLQLPGLFRYWKLSIKTYLNGLK